MNMQSIDANGVSRMRWPLQGIDRLSWRSRTVAIFALAMVLVLPACNDGRSLPNPVESKDGVSYIPIDDTAFLIPEKTWLVGTSRNSTDGSVCCITLHATVPDAQPWSPKRHNEMYPPEGLGKKLEIEILGNSEHVHLHFHEIPQSRWQGSTFIEEPSDQVAQRLRRFRQLWAFDATPDELDKYRNEWAGGQVDRLRAKIGTPMMDTVYYEFIERDRVKYAIRCDDSREPGQPWLDCHLSFPWARTLVVDIHFMRDDIVHIVAMADMVANKLYAFQTAGLAFRAAHHQSSN